MESKAKQEDAVERDGCVKVFEHKYEVSSYTP